MAAATGSLSQWKAEFAGLHQLTQFDYAVAGTAGLLAGLADIFLVQVPRHPGFLGSPAADGGWLSNIVKEQFGDLLPEGTIRKLERKFWVPYDPSTNQHLKVTVEGLGPRTLSDVLLGTRPYSRLVLWRSRHPSGRFHCDRLGREAFQSVAGHMLSDVATKAGLPPPLFGLLQFLQRGGIGNHSISDIARAMYRSGYDFRHFLAGGVTLAITQNPLSVNWAQWLAFFRFVIPQAHWLLIGRENAQAAFVQNKVDASWCRLDVELSAVWAETFGIGCRAVL